jgi:hypothetical protein
MMVVLGKVMVIKGLVNRGSEKGLVNRGSEK